MSRSSKLGWWFLVAPACVTPPQESIADQAIIGGQTAQPADFPTVVALENSPGNWFCTGTLIDPEWVLTAAHCVAGETAAGMSIRFDDANINDTGGGKVVAVAEVHANPGYNDTDWDNDIALLKLATPVTDRAPTPVHRPAVAAATMVIEVGYGDADINGGGAGILRELATPTVDCAAANDPTISGANLLCFDASDGNASCYGDSGGPAFVTIAGKLEVAGITSGGTADSCTSGWDLYTSVAGELDFVDQVLAGTPPPDPDPDPDPNPNPDPAPDPDPGATGAGCTASGGGGGVLVVIALCALLRRRRSR
jgi:secreted trypsin-like serine protease